MDKLVSENVRKHVLAQVTPTQKELDLQRKVIDALKHALHDHPSSKNYSYSFIEEQGSTGRKQTQLRGVADIDLFVGLRPEEYRSIIERTQRDRHHELDQLMTNMVKNWFEPAITALNTTKVQQAYSQHPYLSFKMMNLEIDILGCFDIDSKYLEERGPITAVDRTVHHTRYVADKLTKKKRDDARILKSFVRACHAYGDQCAVGRMGITGVSLELIAIFSKSLDYAFDTLEQLVSKPLDPLNRSLSQLREIPTFKDDYIIIIDPTDYQRNIASSFTPRAYEWVKYRIDRLREASKHGNENKVCDFFYEPKIPTDELPDWLAKHSFVKEFIADESKHYTILRDKLYRLSRRIQIALKTERTGEPSFGDSLVEVYFEEDRYSIGLLIEKPHISSQYLRRGPPQDLVDAVKQFKKTHDNVEVRDGFVWTNEIREWCDSNLLIDKILEDNPIDGLSPTTKVSKVSKKVLNVLYRYVLPIEPSFFDRITKVKDGDHEIPR